jgi:hypothetical protein
MTPDAPAREPWSAEDRARALSPELTESERKAADKARRDARTRQTEAHRVEDRGWMIEDEAAPFCQKNAHVFLTVGAL